MKLTHLGTESIGTGCPSVYATDHGTYVVQGWKIADPDALTTLRERGLPEHEDAIEIPAGLVRHFQTAQ